MSYLSGVVSGQSREGQRIVVAGPEKIGKTTFACDAPNSLLIPLEKGYATIQTPRLPEMLQTWEQVEGLSQELIAGAKARQIAPGSSLVWDSMTALERLMHDRAIRADSGYKAGNSTGLSMATALGGYGKAYLYANDLFMRWTRYMDDLVKHGVNVIVTCHVFAALQMSPDAGEFHQWDLQLHSPKDQKTYGKREFITQWADAIFFLHEPMYVQKAGEGERMNKAIAGNQGRMLGLERAPGWVAGNRYGLTGVLPIPDPNKNPGVSVWNPLAHAIYNSKGIDLFNRSYAQ